MDVRKSLNASISPLKNFAQALDMVITWSQGRAENVSVATWNDLILDGRLYTTKRLSNARERTMCTIITMCRILCYRMRNKRNDQEGLIVRCATVAMQPIGLPGRRVKLCFFVFCLFQRTRHLQQSNQEKPRKNRK